MTTCTILLSQRVIEMNLKHAGVSTYYEVRLKVFKKLDVAKKRFRLPETDKKRKDMNNFHLLIHEKAKRKHTVEIQRDGSYHTSFFFGKPVNAISRKPP